MILCQNAIPITIAIARRGQLVAMVMTQTVEIFIVPQALKEPAATATVIVKGVCLIILYYMLLPQEEEYFISTSCFVRGQGERLLLFLFIKSTSKK